jgi:hypothetical protein
VDPGIQYRGHGGIANTTYHGKREAKSSLLEGRTNILSTVHSGRLGFASSDNTSLGLWNTSKLQLETRMGMIKSSKYETILPIC